MKCSRANCQGNARCRGYCESHYRRLLRMGFFGYQDATEVRIHLEKLRELGWTWGQIVDAAGMSSSVPYNIHNGKYRRLMAHTRNGLLAVPLERKASHRPVDPLGSARRIYALMWMGWPARQIALRAGVKTGTIHEVLLRVRTDRGGRAISHRLAMSIAEVYEELSMVPGPSKQAATKARNAGHHPPLGWDVDISDDPNAKPVGVTCSADGCVNSPVRRGMCTRHSREARAA